ncbi:MAG TPA: MFS transporter [Thermomicrobiales bacterium]|nr:MFS transporter [Chloroflexota bacterium]HBY46926.1 MFS transporter [Chloroflexota bacterium]HCG28401.1 MFS transporter [Chloroflexota bacterium]HQX63608.1 MFS transporter [Thermomicrobiales bacterium]HQZ89875.1 MFS transporter [Thermomicrobiales bacterium]
MADSSTATSLPTGQDNRIDEPRRSGVIALLRVYRDYRLLWYGTLGTQGGQWVLQIALGWLMLDLTNSEFWVGMVGFAGGIPILLFSIPAGILIDRVDRRRILIVCQAVLAALGIALTVVIVMGRAEPWLLLTAAFINGIMMTVNNTTRQVIVADTVERIDLPAAIALNSAGQNATRVIGPSVAGAIIGLVGLGGAFAFQAGLLGLALGLSFMISAQVAGGRVAPSNRGGVLDGVRYIWRNPVLRDLMILATIPTLTVFPYMQLLPVYARDILAIGPQGLGLLMAASGVGAVAGALLVANATHLPWRGLFMLLATIAYGAVIIVFAFSTSVWLSMAMLMLAGLSGSAYMSLNNALLQLNVDDDIRGRVMGVYMLTWGLMPVGALPMGAAAGLVGAPIAIASGALISSALAALLAIRSATLRRL